MPPLKVPRSLSDISICRVAELEAKSILNNKDLTILRAFNSEHLPSLLLQQILPRVIHLSELATPLSPESNPKLTAQFVHDALVALLSSHMTHIEIDFTPLAKSSFLSLLSLKEVNFKHRDLILKTLEQSTLVEFSFNVCFQTYPDFNDLSEERSLVSKREEFEKERIPSLSFLTVESVLAALKVGSTNSLRTIDLASIVNEGSCLEELLSPFKSLVEVTLSTTQGNNVALVRNLLESLPLLQIINGVQCMGDVLEDMSKETLHLRSVSAKQSNSQNIISNVSSRCPNLSDLHLIVKNTELVPLDTFPKCNLVHTLRLEIDGLTPPRFILPLVHSISETLTVLHLFGSSVWAEAKIIMEHCKNISNVKCVSDHRTWPWLDQQIPSNVPAVFPARLLDLIIDDEAFTQLDFESLLKSSCSRNLRLLALKGEFDWLDKDWLESKILHTKELCALEILVLSQGGNFLDGVDIRLDLSNVIRLIQQCPVLAALGELSSWTKIDYFNPESNNYRRVNSKYKQMMKTVKQKNWDLNLEIKFKDLLENWEK